MTKIKLAVFGVLITVALTVLYLPARAQNLPVSITPLAALLLWGDDKVDDFDDLTKGENLLAAVRTVKQNLQKQVDTQLADANYKPRVVTTRSTAVEIIAGIWNEEKNEFDYVRILKNGNKLSGINNNGYNFKLTRDNGVNSYIEITNRPDLKVLGLIYPVFADISTSKQTLYRLENVVYIPYTEKLNNEVIVRAGEDYMDKKINAVYDELNQLGISSLASPGKLITEVIDQATVKAIIAIEHVDATVLINNSADSYLRRFHSTLAVNEHASYAYASSSASARGLVQFIPSTYQSLRRIRPELTLHADFVQGMTDPYNAIKAQIGLLDYNLTLLPGNIKEQYKDDHLNLGAYLAAMYNGGPARVRSAIARWGDTWDAYHGNVSSSLRSETAYYVAKFRLVYDHFNKASLHLAAQEIQ